MVGFSASNFDVIEGQSAQVCLELFNGELETNVVFEISITEVTGTDADTKKLLSSLVTVHVADHFSPIAASDLDITGGPFTLLLFADSRIGCVQIPIIEDSLPEGEEVFIVNAQPFGSRVFLSVGSASVTIEDNESGKKSADSLSLV